MQETILEVIEQADDAQINEMLQAIIRRNDRRFPESEMICLSLPKNDQKERQRILECMTKGLLEETF